MAQTVTQKNPILTRLATGRILDTGTVAAFPIVLGFRPRYIRVMNVTSGDMMEWVEGMTNAHGIKTVAAGTRTIVTSNGITVTDSGFTIGLDTDVNVTSEQLTWVAQA